MPLSFHPVLHGTSHSACLALISVLRAYIPQVCTAPILLATVLAWLDSLPGLNLVSLKSRSSCQPFAPSDVHCLSAQGNTSTWCYALQLQWCYALQLQWRFRRTFIAGRCASINSFMDRRKCSFWPKLTSFARFWITCSKKKKKRDKTVFKVGKSERGRGEVENVEGKADRGETV